MARLYKVIAVFAMVVLPSLNRAQDDPFIYDFDSNNCNLDNLLSGTSGSCYTIPDGPLNLDITDFGPLSNCGSVQVNCTEGHWNCFAAADCTGEISEYRVFTESVNAVKGCVNYLDNTHSIRFSCYGDTVTKSPTSQSPSTSPTLTTAAPTFSPSTFAPLASLDSGFVQIQNKDVPLEADSRCAFGYAVSMNSNGDISASGMPHCGDGGRFYIYQRSARLTKWEPVQGPVQVTGNTGDAHLGEAIAMSGTGEWIAVAGPNDDSSTGAIWMFQRSGPTWSQVQILKENDPSSGASLGLTLAMSRSGSTLAAGRRGSPDGGVVVFSYENDAWSQQGPRLIGNNSGSVSYQGQGIALTHDGNMLFFTSWDESSLDNGVWVYSRNASNDWNPVGDKILSHGSLQGFGYSITCSADGSIFAVGCLNDDSLEIGKCNVQVFVKENNGLYAYRTKIDSPISSATDFGLTVVLSSAGERLLIGDWFQPYDGVKNYFGSYMLFTQPSGGDASSWTQQGTYINGTNKAFGNENTWTNMGFAIGVDSNAMSIIAGGYGDDDYRVSCSRPEGSRYRTNVSRTGRGLVLRRCSCHRHSIIKSYNHIWGHTSVRAISRDVGGVGVVYVCFLAILIRMRDV